MWPTPKAAFLLLWAHSQLMSTTVTASPIDPTTHDLVPDIQTRQISSSSCPPIHVFGARETTVSAGYGSSSTVVNLVLAAYPGATSESITYPACGGQSSCGGVSYANSANQGTAAVALAVNNFNTRCPSSQIVLVGYSQVSN
jgi:acetylxylan esterase